MTSKKIPRLRFRGFSGEWEEKKLKDILETIIDNRGKTPPVQDHGIPLIELNALGDKHIYYNKVSKFVSDKTFNDWFRKHISKGDTLFTTVGQTAFCSIYAGDNKAGIAQNVVGLRPNNSCTNDFLYYLLIEPRNNHKFKKIEMVAVQPSVKVSQMIHLKFRLPSKDEQEKIAGFLGEVDQKIEGLQKEKELLEKYKKGMMQKIFSQEIRFKDKNGKPFPVWQEKKLGELGKFISGVGFSEKEQGGKSGVPFFKVSDMNREQNKYEMLDANNYVTDEQIKKYGYKPIERLSIIFAKVGAAIFLERKRIAKEFLIDNNMMAFATAENIHLIKYIFDMLRLSKFAQVGALPSYNGSDLCSIKVPIPDSKEEQKKITVYLTSLDDKIKLQESKLEQAKQFKKALLQQMFV